MAGDRMLVQGAGQVARAEKTGNLAASKAATNVGAFIMEGTAVVVQARNREFNKAMDAELQRNAGLTDEAYDKLYKKLKSKRAGYVYLNKRGRYKAEKELVEEAEVIKETEMLKTDIANAEIEDPEKDLGPCAADALKGIVGGKQEIVYNADGKPGYNVAAGRACFAADETNPALNEFVKKDENGNPTIESYNTAWDDGRFTISGDGNTKTDKFGNEYPNTEEGFQQFIDTSEEYWAKKDEENELGQFNQLDVNTQTGKRSTNKAFSVDGSPLQFSGSPMKMTSSPYKKDDKNTSANPNAGNPENSNDGKPPADKNFMSIADVKEMVKEGSVDKKSFQAIDGIVAEASSDASKRQVGENSQFNYHNYYNGIRNKIVKNGNLRSLATNTNSLGTTFKEDLIASLKKVSYEDMGVPYANSRERASFETNEKNEKFKSMDPTPGDGPIDENGVATNKITKEDAEQIQRIIFADEQMLGDYVAEYYTNFAEQNFNANLKPEVAQDFSWTQSPGEAKAMATKRFGNGKNYTYQGQRFSTDTPVQEVNEDEFA
jgi:hypothetical protein